MSTATVTTGTTTVTESYLYDWAGTRTAKITDGVLTYYLVDTAGVLSQVLAELDHTGARITHYTRGSELISLSRPGEKHYYLHDGHGSVRALSDADGQVTDTYLFDAFGNLLSKTGTTANDFLYTGEQYDANTGFYYLRARYMNPATGTFTSPDAYAGTIFDPVSLHKYLYANANPVMNRDPSGYFTLTEMDASLLISGIIGAAMNSIPKGIMRLVSGEPMDDMFWFTFASDFIVGFECGIGFAAIGFLATQYLLLSCLVKSILFTMGLKFSFDCIGDLWNGNYGSAILNAIGATFFFFGASGFNYQGSGLGLGGFADDATGIADDAANLGDDVAGAADDAANLGDDAANVLDDASQAAYKAADYVDDFSVSNKHLLDAGGTWQKFATNDKSVINNWIKDAVNSPNAQFLPNNIDGSYRIVTDLGYTVGAKGETTIRVVIGADGKIWTAFPV